MRISIGCLVTLVLLTLVVVNAEQQAEENLIQQDDDPSLRERRQANITTTTARPRKRRPSNFFSLISELISETRNDTRNAVNEIGTIFNSQFAPPGYTRPTQPPDTGSSTTAMAPDGSGDGSSEEVTTTVEPYRLTRDEFMGIIRANVNGLVRLFGKELRNAIRDSNRNVREFGRGFRESLRPYVTVNK